jgi:copper(I)-binding protein
MNKIINKSRLLLLFFGLAINLIGNQSYANGKPNIEIENLRVILPPPVARSTAAYGNIKNTGDAPDTLIKLSSDAGMVMLHQTEITDGRAKMNHIEAYVIQPDKSLVLKPMSHHIMLMEINHDVVKKGGKIMLTLEFEKSGVIKYEIPVSSE